MRALALCALALGCSSGAPAQTCTPEAREALVALYERAAGEVISSGACDKVQRVEECAAYMLVETQMAMAQKAMCE